MTKLHELYESQGQSPWLDNLTRDHLTGGRLAELVDDGIRGVTANPTIFARAISGSAAYDDQFSRLVGQGRSVEDAYWELVVDDVTQALEQLLPLYERSGRSDGFVSLEVAPELAYDSAASLAAAAELHRRIDRPNLLVKIPATAEGIDAIRQATVAGLSINVTLIFSLERYAQVIEAYLSGLEAYAAAGGDLAAVHSVASFFLSRVDTEVDRRLTAVGAEARARLGGQAAVAQAKLAYSMFRNAFTGPRWNALADKGARVQRPLWASTSTKDPAYADTLYIDALIGPDTVTTLPEPTIAAFTDHGTIRRSVDEGISEAARVIDRLAEVGIALGEVGQSLEDEGVASFTKSIAELLAMLTTKHPHPASQ